MEGVNEKRKEKEGEKDERREGEEIRAKEKVTF